MLNLFLIVQLFVIHTDVYSKLIWSVLLDGDKYKYGTTMVVVLLSTCWAVWIKECSSVFYYIYILAFCGYYKKTEILTLAMGCSGDPPRTAVGIQGRRSSIPMDPDSHSGNLDVQLYRMAVLPLAIPQIVPSPVPFPDNSGIHLLLAWWHNTGTGTWQYNLN